MAEWVLENEAIRAVISSDKLGIRLTSLFHIAEEKEWVCWKQTPIFSNNGLGEYDRQYRGGCEFLFPNDVPVNLDGKLYPDHGYLWQTKFSTDGLKADRYGIGIEWTGFLNAINTEVKIHYYLESNSQKLRITTMLKSRKKENQPYLFRFHPSFLISENSRISCFGETISFEQEDNKIKYCTLSPLGKSCSYPNICTKEGELSLEYLPGSQAEEFFCYITQKEGTVVIEDGRQKLKLSYQMEQFPYLVLYYFKVNGERVIIAEPSASIGMDLAKLVVERAVPSLEYDKEKHYQIEIELERV